jgi:hypothetical protein
MCCACELDGPGAQTAAFFSCGCTSTCAACAGANFLDILASHDTPENGIFKCSGCQQKVTEYRVGPRTVKLPVLEQMEKEEEEEDEAEEMSLFFQDNRETFQEDMQRLSTADFEALMKQTRATLNRGIAEEERRRQEAEERERHRQAEERAREAKREKALQMQQRLRDNDPRLTTLFLGSDAAEYMFQPSGCFMGSELERALEHNTAVTSMEVSSAWFTTPGAHQEASTRTLRALRGCKLPLSLDLRYVGRNAVSWLVSTLRGEEPHSMSQGGRAAGSADGGHGGLTALEIKISYIRVEIWHGGLTALEIKVSDLNVMGCASEPASLEELLSVRMADLKKLDITSNPTGQGLGRAIMEFLERNPQLTSLALDEEQAVSVDRYVEELNRAKLLAFAMGLHGRLGAASRVRALGHVRGDKDEAHVFDVPLLKAIAEHSLDAAGQSHRAKMQIGCFINLKVKGQDGNIVQFKIKRTTRLQKLMEAYCARQSLLMDQ